MNLAVLVTSVLQQLQPGNLRLPVELGEEVEHLEGPLRQVTVSAGCE